MYAGKVDGTSKWKNNSPKIVEFFLMRLFEKKIPPKFENDLKCPTFRATVKS